MKNTSKKAKRPAKSDVSSSAKDKYEHFIAELTDAVCKSLPRHFFSDDELEGEEDWQNAMTCVSNALKQEFTYDQISELIRALDELIEIGESVANNWENGNLAEAVSALSRVAADAKGVMEEVTGSSTT